MQLQRRRSVKKVRARPKKPTQWLRSAAHMNFVRKHDCIVDDCSKDAIHAHHVRLGTDGAAGRKPSDYYTVPLCSDHHEEIHKKGEQTFQDKYGIPLREAYMHFMKWSPVEDIRAKRRELEGV